MKVAHQAARDCLKQSQERQQSYYDRTKRQRTFDIGDLVYKLDTTTKVGLTTKSIPSGKTRPKNSSNHFCIYIYAIGKK